MCLAFTEEKDAEEEEPEEEEGEQQLKGPDLKLASRRDMYTICQGAGLGEFQAARLRSWPPGVAVEHLTHPHTMQFQLFIYFSIHPFFK